MKHSLTHSSITPFIAASLIVVMAIVMGAFVVWSFKSATAFVGGPSLTLTDTSFTWSGPPALSHYEVLFCDGTSTGKVETPNAQEVTTLSYDKPINTVSGKGGLYALSRSQSCGGSVSVSGSYSTSTVTYTPNPAPKETTPSTTITQNPTPPSCPIQPKQGRTIVSFSGKKIRSDQAHADARTEDVAVSLAPGTYSVTLASWDGYKGREYVTQPSEQWKVWVEMATGEWLHTGIVRDLPDRLLETLVIEEVNNQNFSLSHGASKLHAKHALFPNTSSPNNVHPICVAFDLVEKEPEAPAPICEIGASSSSVMQGSSVTLTWTSQHTTSGSIDGGVGSVATSGTKSVTVATTTTFTGTFAGAQGKTATCKTTVIATPIPEPTAPQCVLSVSPSVIASATAPVTLTWTSQHATSGSIDGGVGSVATSGSQVVTPGATRTYTGIFSGENGQTVTCTASVTLAPTTPTGGSGGVGRCLNCGNNESNTDTRTGGGSRVRTPEPNVVLSESIVRALPGTFVYLDQVPYTGIEMSPTMTALFWAILFLVSAGLSYLIVVKRVFHRMVGFQLETTPSTRASALKRESEMRPVVVKSTVATAAPLMFAAQHDFGRTNAGAPFSYGSVYPSAASERIERHAQEDGVLFSPEALQHMTSVVGDRGESIVDRVIERAKEEYPREDGWILISRERLSTLLSLTTSDVQARQENIASQSTTTTPPSSASMPSAPAVPAATTRPVASSASRTVPAAALQSNASATQVAVAAQARIVPPSSEASLALFVGWLVSGDEASAFDFIRKVTSQGNSAEAFVANVVRELDEVYKHRIEGGRTPNKDLVQITAHWTNGDFEQVLGMLVESVDHSYASGRVGVKVALAKVFAFFAGKR